MAGFKSPIAAMTAKQLEREVIWALANKAHLTVTTIDVSCGTFTGKDVDRVGAVLKKLSKRPKVIRG